MRAFTFFDLAFLGQAAETGVSEVEDSFNSYTAPGIPDPLSGSAGGTNWIGGPAGVWISRIAPTERDYFKNDYNDNDDVSGLDSGYDGSEWNGPWISRAFETATDDLNSYADGDNLDGKNGGTFWGGAYVSKS